MRVFREKQWFNQWWIIPIYLFLVIFPAFGCYKWIILRENMGNIGPNNQVGIIIIVTLFPFLLIALLQFRLHTVIDERGIGYRFSPIQRKSKLILWGDIKSCYVRQYSPLKEFGGWGYKLGWKDTKAITIKGNKGFQIELKNGEKILVGTQRHQEVEQILNNYLEHERI